MKIIFLGAPGAGKGTQAEIVSKKLNIPTVSTGVIIRKAIKEKSPLGRQAEEFIERGELVPDDVVIEIIKTRIFEEDCKNGFILDGFPRTLIQAKALSEIGVEIDAVVNLEVPEDTIISRLSGRRQCAKCGLTYHITDKPSKDGITCDSCGEKLTIRDDDKPETVEARLRVYHKQTEPLINYYKVKNLLKTVKGKNAVEETSAEVLKILGVN